MDIILLTSSLKKWKEQQCVEERKKGFLIWKTVKKFSIIHPFSYILNDTMTKNPYIFLCRKLSVLVYLFQRQDFEDCHASLQFCKQSIGTIIFSLVWNISNWWGEPFFWEIFSMHVINDFEIVNVLKLITLYFLWPTLWLSKAGPLLHAFVY